MKKIVISYQFDGDSIMGHKVHSEIDPTVSTFSKDIEQLISFAQNSRHFPHNVYELVIRVHLCRRVRGSSSLLGSDPMGRPGWISSLHAWTSHILTLGHIRLNV